MTTEAKKYLTASDVRVRFGGVSDMTLWRWLQDEQMAFPKPLVINRRRLFAADEIAAWEANVAANPEPKRQVVRHAVTMSE